MSWVNNDHMIFVEDPQGKLLAIGETGFDPKLWFWHMFWAATAGDIKRTFWNIVWNDEEWTEKITMDAWSFSRLGVELSKLDNRDNWAKPSLLDILTNTFPWLNIEVYEKGSDWELVSTADQNILF